MSLPNIATPKQRLVYKYGLRHRYSIWGVDPRLGKTLCTLATQQRLEARCLVICPGYLVANWAKEVRKWCPASQVTAFKKGKDIYEPFDQDFVIISYGLVQKAEHLFEWANMVVLDEAHAIKSLAAKRTQFIHRCIYENSIKRVHLLSGTVLKNRVKEFYSLLAIMYYSPGVHKRDQATRDFLDRFPDEITFADYFSYRKEYSVRIKDRRGRSYSMPVARWEGLRNLEELKKYLKGCYIRVKAGENDLPPLVERDVLISDSPNKALLDAFNEYFKGEGSGSVKPDVKVAAALKKVPFTIKYVEDLLEEAECCLVYSDHVQPIEEIAKHFGVPAITGKTPGAKRAALAAEFQAGKGRILCATIGALKEGQDLFRAKDIVISDPPWIPGDLNQVVNRIRGLGQKDTRVVHKIHGSPQDEKIYQALADKQKTITQATD